MKKVEWTLEIYMPSLQIIMRKRPSMCWNINLETALKLEQLCWLLGSYSELRFLNWTAGVSPGESLEW